MTEPGPLDATQRVVYAQFVNVLLDQFAAAVAEQTHIDTQDVLTATHRAQIQDVLLYAAEHTTTRSFAVLSDVLPIIARYLLGGDPQHSSEPEGFSLN